MNSRIVDITNGLAHLPCNVKSWVRAPSKPQLFPWAQNFTFIAWLVPGTHLRMISQSN